MWAPLVLGLFSVASAFRSPGGFVARQPQRRVATKVEAVPLVPAIGAACVIPTTLGFWKREYGVSYAYGSAVAASAAVVLTQSAKPLSCLAKAHALVHLAYGVRLCLYLLWRESTVLRFRKMREKIERSAPPSSSLVERITTRTPFVLGCSFLYFAMSMPLVLSATGAVKTAQEKAFAKYALYAAATGFGLNALGDTYKALVKQFKGPNALVTGGPYALFRHPNYQGEQLLWAASAALGLAMSLPLKLKALPVYAAVALGQLGINFVLMSATGSLNNKQQTSYGDMAAYKKWKAWKGFAIKPSAAAVPATTAVAKTDVSSLY